MSYNATLPPQDIHFDKIFFQRGWLSVFTDGSIGIDHICFTALFHLLRMFPDGSDSSKCKRFAQAIIRGSISLLLLPITVMLGIICLLFSCAKNVCFEWGKLVLHLIHTICLFICCDCFDLVTLPCHIVSVHIEMIIKALFGVVYMGIKMFRFHVNVGLEVDSSVIFDQSECSKIQGKLEELPLSPEEHPVQRNDEDDDDDEDDVVSM